MSTMYKLGDLVWAKMKGFPIWPGKIAKPIVDMKKPPAKSKKGDFQCILFFGSNNYAWIENAKIKPYYEFKETFTSSCKTSSFKDAVTAIENYIKDREKYPDLVDFDPAEDASNMEFDRLKAPTPEPKPKEKKPRKESVTPKSATKRSITSESTTPVVTKKSRRTVSNEDTNGSPPLQSGTISKNYEYLLNRPIAIEQPEAPKVDMNNVSQILLEKQINPSKLQFGFLGLGIMGSGIVKNLLDSGHNVVLWNRTPSKCADFVAAGAKMVQTPSDVIEEADITFSCVADPQAAKDMVFGNCGVLHAKDALLRDNKGYVEMTGIDAVTSKDLFAAITSSGGRYLEAQLLGSKTQAEEGSLIILTAGDKNMYLECQSCFTAIGKTSLYLGDVGNATKMNLVLQLMSGIALAGLAEGMSLADKAGLATQDVLEVLQLTSLACPLLIEKSKSITAMNFSSTHHPLKHMRKDMKLSLDMADILQQPIPLASQANEVYKHAIILGYGNYDSSAVFLRSRF